MKLQLAQISTPFLRQRVEFNPPWWGSFSVIGAVAPLRLLRCFSCSLSTVTTNLSTVTSSLPLRVCVVNHDTGLHPGGFV